MNRLARLARLGLTVGTAVVLAIGLTSSAEAATGRIRYFTAGGQEFQIDNPPDNVCINLRARAQILVNETNKTVSYYFAANCVNFTSNLAPGRAVSYQNPLSVRVIG
ncbi:MULTISPECIES: hypothetical protein [Streptomyces]|uniref:hypothetical protein n=1 Tax=Streptomyces TaxID=1883 RepID=UPI0016793C88|nr:MULTISPECIES: hypothetical protein [Streptomyces]MBK3526576.1 hypothetical protein [Streptomyces sp. MBT70]GGS02741.1 hypothetical protein GCM10010236_66760 [Streptomyces eurythermus]